MSSHAVSLVFGVVLLLQIGLKFWLAGRQARHVAQHRGEVPAQFRDQIGLESHQRAADYTQAKLRFGLGSTAVGTAILLGWTLLGGLDRLNGLVLDWAQGEAHPMRYQLALLAAFALVNGLLDLPLSAWSAFRVEQAFGFNRMTPALFVADALKGALVGAILGLPIAACVLWIMGSAGSAWWLIAWAVWMVFNLLMLVLVPTVIAPLFNKFSPLDDAALKARVEALLARCGFRAQGLFVMDGSRRSAHANAYFTGFGAAKRVVFFDTLLSKLTHDEVEAVLAHELGHYKRRHIAKRVALLAALSLAGFAALGWLSSQASFYTGLGVRPSLGAPNDAVALLLFLLAGPVLAAFIGPLMAAMSRRHEYEADAYACQHTSAPHLSGALVKLYQDNASTLTPDPLYVRVYYSHPPAVERIRAMAAAAA